MQVVVFPEIRLYRPNVGRGYNYKARGSFGRQGGFIKEIALSAKKSPSIETFLEKRLQESKQSAAFATVKNNNNKIRSYEKV